MSFSKHTLIASLALSICSIAQGASLTFLGQPVPNTFRYGIVLDPFETLTVVDGDSVALPVVPSVGSWAIEAPLIDCFRLGPTSPTSVSWVAQPGGCTVANPDPEDFLILGAFGLESSTVLGTVPYTTVINGVTVNGTIAGPIDPALVPEPSSWALLCGGGLLLGLFSRCGRLSRT